MSKYNPGKIERKHQKTWADKNVYFAKDSGDKNKRYVLIEFPYPSGEGLHMGHLRPYVAGDVYSRYLRMKGHEVMYPIGWDAFGLPAENFAIKKGIHPSVAVEKNIENAKKQVTSWGISFDWSREVNTTDPDYYKWTQWIFLQLYKAGLAYEATGVINWCPKDKTGLANEEVIDGHCERCGTKVEKKELRQWYLKITKYADKLLKGLENLNWPEPVKLQQENWIGKSEGVLIKFKIKDEDCNVEVFTTRADTLFGATYLVLAPEHPLIENLKSRIENLDEVETYVERTKQKSDLARQEERKEKTGVELKGIKAINPASKEEIPVWIADYVLASYGTGAIMAVPAHDERDFEFAKKFKLSIKEVISGGSGEDYYDGQGKLVNSGEFTGLDSDEAKIKITEFVGGKKEIKYKLRDWVFSRQRYWGEPIPIIHCEKCGTVPVPEKDLPVKLPDVKKYEPTGTGESPLAAIDKWVNVKCPSCDGAAKRETNTMPQWAGSSWYYLRYADSRNDKKFADEDKLKYWLPVDVYFGGMEHTTLHLLYSRFWHLFLYDQGLVPTPEPYARRITHGIILGPDGEKMSKSRGNVVNPQEIVEKYGADTLRMYEMFLGPHGDTIAWNDQGILGVWRFLNRVWNFYSSQDGEETDVTLEINKTIKAMTGDIENFRFNTGVSELMKILNILEGKKVDRVSKEIFAKLLAPFAPHIAEEIWCEVLKNKGSIALQAWPEYDESLLAEEEISLVVQINGKVRDVIKVKKGLPEEEAKVIILSSDKIKDFLKDQEIKKFIYIQDRLTNIVI